MDLWQHVDAAASARPSDLLLLSRQGGECTVGEFRDRALVMAAGFADLGVRPGDVVSWELPTWIDTVVLAAALSRLGAVQNPIIHIYRDREVGFCVRQTGSSLLVTPDVFAGHDFAAMADRITTGTSTRSLTFEPGSFPVGDPAALDPHVPARPDETRWICYTSGTTADPKGARHSDATVGSFPAAMGQRMEVGPGDRYSLTFPFPHIGGIGLLFLALSTGCTLLLDAEVHPVDTVEFLSANGCTHAGTGAAFFSMYLAAQAARTTPLFPSLRACPAGGAPTPIGLHHRVRAELGGVVVSAWGLTEAPVLSSGALDDPLEKLEHTEGRPLPGVEISVVDAEGNDVPPGEPGELRVRAPQMMLGYQDPALDADAFDEQGRYCTGDLGQLDADGYVVITGRLKDVIIRNGENVSAKEVEDALSTLPQVADVAVVGRPDDRTGERVCAVVVWRSPDVTLALDEIRDALAASGLRRQALPEQLVVLDALPRNPAGKVLKQQIATG